MRICAGKPVRSSAALRTSSAHFATDIRLQSLRTWRNSKHQLAGVQARLKTSDPRTVKLQIRDTRRFVESRLEDLSALWDGEPRIAREEIAKHVGKITLKPMFRMYIATGVWDWLGVLGTAAAMVVPGARIELATPAFSGRRSTNELPRHK